MILRRLVHGKKKKKKKKITAGEASGKGRHGGHETTSPEKKKHIGKNNKT